MIKIKEVSTKNELNAFVKLPYSLHKNHKEWTPPLISDEFKVFDKNKNHLFNNCDTLLLLAYKNNKLVGRIMGIINYAYNEANNENNVRFYALESINEINIIEQLLETVKEWAKQKSMNTIIGPLGFSDKDPQGFLYQGFEKSNTVMVTNCSFQYLITHIEELGYTKKLDLFQYRVELKKDFYIFYEKQFKKLNTEEYKLLEFTKSKEIKTYVPDVFKLVNETYSKLYGFSPLSEIEIKEFSDRFIPLLDPKFIKIVLKKDRQKVIGFFVAMPDISVGLKKAKGKLFPIGFYHILKSMKKTNQLNLLLGSVHTEERNKVVTSMLTYSMLRSALKANLTHADSHLILEDNVKMRATIERLDSKVYKKYRVYEKQIL